MNQQRSKEAKLAAERIWHKLVVEKSGVMDYRKILTAFVLDPRWEDTLTLYDSVRIPLGALPGFEELDLALHQSSTLEIGFLDRAHVHQPVAVLRGRVGMFDAPRDPAIPKMVRLQIAMLCEMGARRFVLTQDVDGWTAHLKIDDLVFIGDFETHGCEEMPLWRGEQVSPSQAIEEQWEEPAQAAAGHVGLDLYRRSSYVHRQPHLLGTNEEVPLRHNGAVVGTAFKPECCVLTLYGAHAACIGLVTSENELVGNDAPISPELRVKLGKFLTMFVNLIS